MSTIVAVRHAVEDFEKWKVVFDEHRGDGVVVQHRQVILSCSGVTCGPPWGRVSFTSV